MSAELEELDGAHPDWGIDAEGNGHRSFEVEGVTVSLLLERAFDRHWVVRSIDIAIGRRPPAEPVSDLDSWQLDSRAGLLWREVPRLGASAFLPADARQEARDAADAILGYAEAMLDLSDRIDVVLGKFGEPLQ